MARPRKHHVQQGFEFRTWGGKREGAGRKAKGRRKERHASRPQAKKEQPSHVVLRVADALGSLRKRDCYQAIRGASFAVLRRLAFRIIHISIQSSHVHLIVEADHNDALARGMRAFAISAARRLNRAYEKRTGRRRRGSVFVDRYHREVITSARQARHTLSYVLNNWRKHGEHLRGAGREWKVDPFSTAMAFYGWKEQPVAWRAPETYQRMAVCVPETWLMYGAWKQFPAISVYEVPSKPKVTSR